VLATRGTLASAKFRALEESLRSQAKFVLVPCDGLAAAIEADDQAHIRALCARYTQEAGRFGSGPGEIDTLVLGCTHYPFATGVLRRHAPASVRFLDTGAPVSLRTRQLLAEAGLLAGPGAAGGIELTGSGDLPALEAAARRWLAPAPGAQVSKDTDPAQRVTPQALPAA
jgi:glutamate racemase